MLENFIIWGIFGILGLIIIILFLKFLKNSPLNYFSKMDMSHIITRDMKIPVIGIKLNAKLVLPKFILNQEGNPRTKLPLIFLNHGWGMSMKNSILMQWAIVIALSGPYAVLVYECRGHGKSPGKRKLTNEIFDDIPKVFDFGEKLDHIDSNRMGFIGMSFGGEVALTRAYVDERIKAIVSIVSPHNAKANFTRKPENFKAKFFLWALRIAGVNGKKISDEINEKISPKYILDKTRKDLNSRIFLINARHDNLIHISEFEKNREILELPEDQFLIIEKGGHATFHQELLVLSNTLRFFKLKL